MSSNSVISPNIPEAASSTGNMPAITVIAPSTGWISLKIQELWDYRELIYFLTWRDIKVRYKQTALGAAWAIIQPFFTMLVFSLLPMWCSYCLISPGGRIPRRADEG